VLDAKINLAESEQSGVEIMKCSEIKENPFDGLTPFRPVHWGSYQHSQTLAGF